MGDRGLRDKEMRRCWLVQRKTGQVLGFQFHRGKDLDHNRKLGAHWIYGRLRGILQLF